MKSFAITVQFIVDAPDVENAYAEVQKACTGSFPLAWESVAAHDLAEDEPLSESEFDDARDRARELGLLRKIRPNGG